MKQKKSLVSAVFSATIVATGLMATPAQSAPERAVIAHQYIVTLDPALLPAPLAKLGLNDLVDSTLVLVGGGKVLQRYGTALTGFAAVLSPNQAEALAKLPFVKTVEADQQMRAVATQTGAVWGIDRIDQRNLPLDGQYIYRDQAGAGVHVYVVDTGLNASHSEFTGRVGTGRNFAPNSDGVLGLGLFGGSTDASNTTDCNGHGTHVSGTAVGTTYGVAKKATIHSVRVLGCNGSGSNSNVIAGIDWVAANAVKPAVANMSLGGGNSDTLDTAVKNAIAKGIAFAVAAGNDSANACTGSPNKVPEAITVGATDKTDTMASYSNYGSCVDLFAPGSDVVSANYANNTGSTTLSGTSMASPHVAGAVAILLGQTPAATPAQLVATLTGKASSGKLKSLGANSPSLLLYSD
jgi:subtilisin family serine protease